MIKKETIEEIRELIFQDVGENIISDIRSSYKGKFDEDIDEEKAKEIFESFPADILGLGLAWDFRDTEVREMIYEFLKK